MRSFGISDMLCILDFIHSDPFQGYASTDMYSAFIYEIALGDLKNSNDVKA